MQQIQRISLQAVHRELLLKMRIFLLENYQARLLLIKIFNLHRENISHPIFFTTENKISSRTT